MVAEGKQMAEQLVSEQAPSGHISGSDPSSPVRTATTAALVDRTTEPVGLHDTIPSAADTDAIKKPPGLSLSEIAALLDELRVLLRHLLHRQPEISIVKPTRPGTTRNRSCLLKIFTSNYWSGHRKKLPTMRGCSDSSVRVSTPWPLKRHPLPCRRFL
jgi:hypothetical protein